MTRVLEFTGPKAPKRFALCWATLMAGGDGKGGERTREVIRKEAPLQTAFEAISDLVASTNGTGAPERTLREGTDLTLTLPQDEFDLLVGYSEKTQWNPMVSKDVVDLWDWFSTAEKRD